jgi:hypothetical protein
MKILSINKHLSFKDIKKIIIFIIIKLTIKKIYHFKKIFSQIELY